MNLLLTKLSCLVAATTLLGPVRAQNVVVGSPTTQTQLPLLTRGADKPLVRVGFAANPSVVTEGDLDLILDLELSMASLDTVDVSVVASGSAQLGVDYTLSTQLVSIAPGATSAQIALSALTDGVSEDVEYVDLELVSPSKAHVGLGSRHRVYLNDVAGASLSIPGAVSSDDFDRCGGLNAPWSVVDPLGDALVQVNGVGTGQATLSMEFPAGLSHLPWNNLNCPQVLQPLGAGDFEVELAFLDTPTTGESYGVLIKEDNQNWLRFDFYRNSATIYAFVGRTVGAQTHRMLHVPVGGVGGGLWMRVGRVGDRYLFRVSRDGSNWITLGSFEYAFLPSEIGPFLGNFASNPAGSMEVDYLFDAALPIEP
ncbi:MAG: hypothetical protein KDB61_09065, partial [Planctomycetes bacterium]|nr:hypothetical protein [Planctomycetota bacterium]